MRISDWSSDVCSSDLLDDVPGGAIAGAASVDGEQYVHCILLVWGRVGPACSVSSPPSCRQCMERPDAATMGREGACRLDPDQCRRGPWESDQVVPPRRLRPCSRERKRVASGKRVSVRVDLGGLWDIKTKKKKR